jgi:polyribonucleotide nucleotidyltransferase
MFKTIQKTINLGDGRIIEIETGKLAKQADGSVVVKMGNTMLLATVVASQEPKEDADFMPLSCEYKEKYASVGRFPGGFLKREARPSDYEILISRLIDRALRPLFPENFHAETFVNVLLISADKDTMPDALAGLAASAAIAVSDIPFNGPISEVRVSRINGKFVINPPFSENVKADIDIIVGATYDNIIMVEGEMKEVSEEEMLEAIKFAHEAIKVQCMALKELTEMTGKTEKRVYSHENNDEVLRETIRTLTYEKVLQVAKKASPDKHERKKDYDLIKEEFIATLVEPDEHVLLLVDHYYHDIIKEVVRNVILNDGIRPDGRTTEVIRPIWCEVDYLPSAHGSALFTRGETQSLTTVTLGAKMNEQMLDGVMITGYDKFILHYNFPPFSTGEAKPYRGTGRREVGHGNLAHRAIKNMIPNVEEGNPYTIRIVSDILESNGSSSMATVCAGTLALLDAGIKMKKPVSGIAMGLITDIESGKYAILSDILGDEDHLGDMDFKVTGTKDGITATQMDIKTAGLSYEILTKALNQAKEGRLHILGKILEAMPAPREDYKPFAPRIITMIIAKDQIGAVIGPGGKIIQDIQATTGSTITIEEVDNKGIVEIFADNKDSLEAARKRVRAIVAIPEVGEIYSGKVKSLVAFGAFVEILPGKDALLHISDIDWRRLNTPDEVIKEGEIFDVKVTNIDSKTGKIKVSRKALLPRPQGQ